MNCRDQLVSTVHRRDRLSMKNLRVQCPLLPIRKSIAHIASPTASLAVIINNFYRNKLTNSKIIAIISTG